MRRSSFRVFSEEDLSAFLHARRESLRRHVESETEDYILNVNETQYVEFLVERFQMDPLVLDFEGVFVDSEEREIPAERFPGDFHVRRGKSYPREVVIYHIPFTGPEELLRFRASTFVTWYVDGFVVEGCLCFELIDFYGAERIRRSADDIQNTLGKQLEYLTRDLDDFNRALPSFAEEVLDARKKKLLAKGNLLASLGVPVRKRADRPATFSIPPPEMRKRILVQKPEVTERGFTPEPALDDATYQSILRTLHEAGKQLERQPSVYEGAPEEALRDLLLFHLQPQFEGAATGETFNKAGKTDILLRHQNSNVFVAECKHWSGEKAYLEALDQLLKYLTWRDSKAAVILFVRNEAITPVVQTVESATPSHPNFIAFAGKQDEAWFNYRLHLSGDQNRELRVAVLLYHLPPLPGPSRATKRGARRA